MKLLKINNTQANALFLRVKNLEDEVKRLNKHIQYIDDSLMSMAINIIIDESDPQNVIFVEIENDKGDSINIGERSDYDEFTKIKISALDIMLHPTA